MSLSQSIQEELEHRLVEERESVVRHLDQTDKMGLGESMKDSLSELSLVDNHPADIGDELFERSKDLALRELSSIRLQKIDRALDRITAGTYGTCEECNQPIAYARLEAEPAASLCLICQEKQDKELDYPQQRPVEEDFLYPGFPRTDMDLGSTISYNGYDGEDSWQDVAKYGTSSNLVVEGEPYDGEQFIESEEPIGYVEDVEGFLTADIYGNPTGFTRNAAYFRNARDQEELI